MGDISDHRPDHMLMEFTPDADLAARIRERLPRNRLPPKPAPPAMRVINDGDFCASHADETDAERAIRETEEALRAELGE